MTISADENRLITENMGLISIAVKRYIGFGVDYEDLFQIGSVGLIKAAKAFDKSKNLQFSTYAVAKITGEIKTYLRDNGEIKVSRSVKEQRFRIDKATRNLTLKLGREPKISEIAKECEMSTEEIIYALDATQKSVSLDIPPDEGGIVISEYSQEEKALNKVIVSDLLHMLDVKERQLITLRYFADKTQAEVSKELGLSQVAVSRMEKKILTKLKERV